MTRCFCDLCEKEAHIKTLTDIYPVGISDRFFVDICEDCINEIRRKKKLKEATKP